MEACKREKCRYKHGCTFFKISSLKTKLQKQIKIIILIIISINIKSVSFYRYSDRVIVLFIGFINTERAVNDAPSAARRSKRAGKYGDLEMFAKPLAPPRLRTSTRGCRGQGVAGNLPGFGVSPDCAKVTRAGRKSNVIKTRGFAKKPSSPCSRKTQIR